jgi:hypothetical protein
MFFSCEPFVLRIKKWIARRGLAFNLIQDAMPARHDLSDIGDAVQGETAFAAPANLLSEARVSQLASAAKATWLQISAAILPIRTSSWGLPPTCGLAFQSLAERQAARHRVAWTNTLQQKDYQ